MTNRFVALNTTTESRCFELTQARPSSSSLSQTYTGRLPPTDSIRPRLYKSLVKPFTSPNPIFCNLIPTRLAAHKHMRPSLRKTLFSTRDSTSGDPRSLGVVIVLQCKSATTVCTARPRGDVTQTELATVTWPAIEGQPGARDA